MGNSLEKFKTDEKIKICWLRNLGDVVKTSEETGIDIQYVKKVCDKERKREQRDVNVLISNNLMQNIMFNYNARRSWYLDILKKANAGIKIGVSDCCKAVVKPKSAGIQYCSKCKKICDTIEVDSLDNYAIVKDLLVELRREDESLMVAADKMGFTQREASPITVNKTTQNILVLGKENGLNGAITQNIDTMDPMDRERLRKNIEQSIINNQE